MESKKTIVAIIVVVILIIGLVGVSYIFNDFNTKQIKLLTDEANKILESNLIKDEINFYIKTEKDYATVEKAIKEYVVKLKNIYLEMRDMTTGINPNSIFSAQNVHDKNLEEIDNIINEYKEKCQNYITELEELLTDEKIEENISKKDFSMREDYYIDLYDTVMLGDVMKEQYETIEEQVKNEKGALYEKLNKIEKIKEFLEENEKSWEVKDDKISFSNLNKMTEYYGLINQLAD